jgi:hypothetical protein
MNVTIQVQCPETALAVLCQLLRDFEQRDPAQIHLQVTGSQVTATEQEMHAMLAGITPPMEIVATIRPQQQESVAPSNPLQEGEG